MPRSMTAYSRVKKNFQAIELTFEIQAHNKRHLDVHLKLPAEFQAFDALLRKVVSQHITRGYLSVTLFAHFLVEQAPQVQINVALAKKMSGAIDELAKELKLETISTNERLSRILSERGVLQVAGQANDELAFQDEIVSTLEYALQKLIQVKNDEGSTLEEEFLSRLLLLDAAIEKIAECAKNYPEMQFLKMKELLLKLLDEGAKDLQEAAIKEIALKEIALLAQKCDITEEIVRFCHHLSHFRKVLKSKDEIAVGKTLEFILQELQREINTIGAKSQDGQISTLVIECKSEIEKIREQVQNVE